MGREPRRKDETGNPELRVAGVCRKDLPPAARSDDYDTSDYYDTEYDLP
jgi:hypothetical protein